MSKIRRTFNAWVTPEVNSSSVFKRCHVSSIVFDQRFGRGVSLVNSRLNARGFVVMMTPRQFMALTDCTPADNAATMDHMRALHRGRSLASPYIYIDFDTPLPRVIGHKGLNRISAILASERYGDIPVPVIIRPNPKGRTSLHDINDKLLTNLRGPVYTENGGIISPTGIERIYIQGERKEMNDLLQKKQVALDFTR